MHRHADKTAVDEGGDPSLATRLEVADWRRQTVELYAIVRSMADCENAWHYWRRTRDHLFKEHPASPVAAQAREAFKANDYYRYDPAWRFAVDLTPISGAEPFIVDLADDGEMSLTACAMTSGLAGMTGMELTVFQINGYAGGLFLPFRDADSGRDSFGGGRYLLDTIKGADLGRTAEGETVLDFNFAYFPSCAYDSQWVCPLAPPENHLQIAVKAGQRGLGHPD
jgi:uncharacterized protein (DUF1684 family)